MIIRNFKNSDIENAKELSHLVWGDFLKIKNVGIMEASMR